MKDLLKLFSFLKPYWKKSVFALIFITAGVIIDMAIPRLIQKVIDMGIIGGDSQQIIQTTLVMLGISILGAGFAVANNLLSVQVGEAFARDLREALFLKIQDFSFGNLDKLQTGQLIVRLTSDTTILQRVFRMSLRIGTRAPLLMISSLFLMFSTNKQLTLQLLPLFLITAIMIIFFVTKAGPMFMAVQKKLDHLNTVLQENIAGVRVVKAFDRSHFENKRFEERNEEFAQKNIAVMQLMAVLFPLLMVMINAGIVFVIWQGGLQSIQGSLTIGEIVAFSNYLLTMMTPLMIMAMIANVLAGGFASAERVVEILESVPEIEDLSSDELPQKSKGHVAFENVSFHYNGASDAAVLEDINLIAEPGETIAILGATGSGKSTLVNLIPRFYEVSSGKISIDGMNIRQISQDSLLSQIGIALQETILFSGSVRDNIRYGRPQASEEEVIKAAKAAQAHDFICGLPEGYDSDVSQRGTNLSGGQKQRIAIARALLTRPMILILDDSTSAVDVETETKIQEALEEIMQTSTSFIVAQRISTVLNADKIIIIDKGRIVAEGNHQQLLKSNPIYQEIYDSQLGDGFTLGVN
ncbi:MAG: ABC transporter ATP-binding protein [Anaerolineaceae bacterium]|nr:ABC transporter ATP-binding protein [Anaerolineaceae bacterium]